MQLQRSFFILTILFFIFGAATAQNITSAIFKISDNSSEIKTIHLTIDDLLLEINTNRNTLEFNTNTGGEITYWEDEFEREKFGKLKSIGNKAFDYYTHWDGDEKKGKIKSIGDKTIDYYTHLDGEEKQGKLKNIGTILFDYYTKWDDIDKQDKIKSIGNITIDYFTKWNDEEKKGKVKLIGNINIDYWTKWDDITKTGKVRFINGNTVNVYAIKEY